MTYGMIDVVLVEDNPADAELTIREFKRNHITERLFLATDGKEALDYLFNRGKYQKTEMPRVLILDIKMPGLNGMDVLKEIRANERTRRLPVVILTSSREESDLRECYELGANSYVVKPVSYSDFSLMIRNLGGYWLHLNETLAE